MRLGHIEIPCVDPKRSADFYVERLGFEIETTQGGKFFWLKRDGMSFLLRPKSGGSDSHAVVFYSPDVEQEAGRIREAGVEVRFGSDNCHHFRDPEGHPLQVVDPEADHSG